MVLSNTRVDHIEHRIIPKLEDRQLAREAGFRWNDPVKGAWTRRLSTREAAELPFPVVTQDAI